jgi:imidazolonepropionase-like amidohydrolase
MVRMRGLAAAGKLWSPRIYVAGDWRQYPEQSVARNLAAYQVAGYDFIKLHGETGALLDSIATAAHLLGIPFMGHVEDSVPHALAVHYASIEHLTGYPGAGISPNDTLTLADTTRLPELIAATQRAGVWNCPTQGLYELWDTDPETWPERQYGPSIAQTLQKADAATVLWWRLRRRIIKALQDEGAGLLLGTDAPLVPFGFGVHRELQALVRAGLTPYQALATGTRNVAAYFGQLHEEGTVAVGKRADLVLLTGNPLNDITHTMNPAGVMVNGRWLSRATIDRGLAAAAAKLAAARKAEAAQRKQGAAP